MYKQILIIALGAVAICGLPTTVVDQNGGIRRPETTGVEKNDASLVPEKKLSLENDIELEEDPTRATQRPKRNICLGLVSVCREGSDAMLNLTTNILDNEHKNLELIMAGFVNIAASLARPAGSVSPSRNPEEDTSHVYLIPAQ